MYGANQSFASVSGEITSAARPASHLAEDKEIRTCERCQPSVEDTLGKARDLTWSNGFSQRGLGYLTVFLAGVDSFFMTTSHSTSAGD